MTVRIFGYEVEITGGFLLTALILSLSYLSTNPAMVLVFALVLFFSVLVHEFGHALAFRAFGVRSSIRLQFLGGLTIPETPVELTRPKQFIVSFAGPFFGFLLAGAFLLVDLFTDVKHAGFGFLIQFFITANIFWSLLNLAPVLPFDGGHMLQALLGPKRIKATLIISGSVAFLIAAWGLASGLIIAAVIFGISGMQAFAQLRNVDELVREAGATTKARRERQQPVDENVQKALREAKAALDADEPDVTIAACEAILSRPSGQAEVPALTLLAWALLQKGEFDKAALVVGRLNQIGQADPALFGSVALARGDVMAAKNVLEAARFSGDGRKEVFGPLIQAYLRLGDSARAAGVALDHLDGISADDVRALAGMMADAKAHGWAGKLFEANFKRDRDADDAFEGARMYARAGERTKAVDLMKLAVAAGFDDSARVYADEALVGLDELDHVLPRPS